MVATVTDIVNVAFTACLGVLFDLIGRRIPLVFGMTIIAVGMFCVPLETKVVPWFVLFRTIITIGQSFGANCPLLVDYVLREDIGKA